MVSGVTLPLSRSTSAKMGRAPVRTTQLAEAMNERGVTITSSPWPDPPAVQGQLEGDCAVGQRNGVTPARRAA